MQARYYDPLIGRFLSIDPVGFSPDQPFMFNRYTYVNNDPLNGNDPTGMACNNLSGSCPGDTPSKPLTAVGDLIVDFTPFIGDAKGIREAVANPTKANIAAAAVGIVPGIGDLAGKGIKAAAKSGGDAKSAVSGLNLQKQLASESQMSELASGGGTVISQPAKQAERIASETGANPSNIQKVSSSSFVAKDGQQIQTHAFRNSSNNAVIEPKTIIREDK